MIKKILVSQPKPASDKSPYFDLEKDFGVECVFRPFFKVERVTPKEFRAQKVNILDYTAVIFTSRHAIDHFFKMAKDLHITIPETVKYFCTIETIALYIQKYASYRKRKVFYGTSGKIDDLLPLMAKHKADRFLVPLSSANNGEIKELFDSRGFNHTECVLYRTVSNDFTKEEQENFNYDMILFFSPTGVKALKENFPGFVQGDIHIGAFGPATKKAIEEEGLRLDLEVPTARYPSMTAALRHYLRETNEED